MSWYETSARRTERHRFRVDLVATLILGGLAVLLSVVVAGPASLVPGRVDLLPLWAVLMVAPLPWRRTQPVWSTAAVALAALTHVAAGVPLILPADVAILVALYSVTVYGPVWAHRAALGVALGGAGLLGAIIAFHDRELGTGLGIATLSGALVMAAWALGLVRRSRQDLLDTLRERARSLEIERDQQAQLATAAERARIAREMHDIVAHSLSVMIAQADGGRYAARSSPEAAGTALEVIAETGRAALADMRRLLGVLRSDDDAGRAGNAPRAPQPGMSPAWVLDGPGTLAGAASGGTGAAGAGAAGTGATAAGMGAGGGARGAGAPPSSATTNPAGPRDLEAQIDDADLGSLVEQARGAGMKVSLVRMGTARRLPPGAGLTLHRVCQEALTNVRKHGGPGVDVTVVVRWQPAAVELEVSDDGRGAAATEGAEATPGYGLLGMSERAALFGGTVTAGPRPGGGWRVRFTMPLPTATA